MENKLNIAMFSDSFYPIIGGRENVIHNIMSSLNNKSNSFLLTTTFKGHKQFINDNDLPYKVSRCKGLRITKNEYLSIIDKKTKSFIEDKLKNGEIDIIHTQTKYALTKYALKLGKKYNVPVITSAHTNYLEQYKNQLKLPLIYKPLLRHVRNIINKTNGVITVSNHMERILQQIGVKIPVKIIPNGNDIGNFSHSKTELDEVLTKYNLQNEQNIFIYVGRITETKNLTFLFNSLKILKDRNLNYKFIMIGSGEIDKYKKLATTLGIADNCLFTGPITDRKELAKLYNISTLNLYPSTGESFGLTIREAGALGTPSVVIENCATAEDIIHGENGFISKPNEIDYAESIISALEDKSKLEKISTSAQNTLNNSWDRITDLHIDYYLEVIKKYKEQKNTLSK